MGGGFFLAAKKLYYIFITDPLDLVQVQWWRLLKYRGLDTRNASTTRLEPAPGGLCLLFIYQATTNVEFRSVSTCLPSVCSAMKSKCLALSWHDLIFSVRSGVGLLLVGVVKAHLLVPLLILFYPWILQLFFMGLGSRHRALGMGL